MFVAGITTTFAQAQIKFDKSEYNFGTFSEDSPVQKCTFTFTNVGDKPRVINQAAASCGCTIPTYTKNPVKPGEKGTVEVTLDDTEVHRISTGTVLHFPGEVHVGVNAIEDSDFFVYLINRQ